MKKEFKPLPKDKQTEEQQDKVLFVNEQRYDHPVVKNWHGKWKEEIAWFYGDQYKYYNEGSEDLEDVIPYPERNVKNVYNRIFPLIRQQKGELRFNHSFFVEPNTTEPEDIKAAKFGSKVVEFTNNSGKFNSKLSESDWWMLITGNVFWKEWWNKDLNGLVKGTGKPTRESGNNDYNYVNPFNVRPDPLAKSREGWRWFIELKRVARSSVEEEFGLPSGTLPAESKDDIKDAGLYELDDYKTPKEPTVVRMEFWEKPSEAHPKGRFMVTVEDWLLYDGVNPSPGGQIPYFQLPGIVPILGEPWYKSAVRVVMDAQRQFNRANSIVDEHIEYFRTKGMIPFGSLRGRDEEAFTRAGIDFVTFNPRVGQPYFQNPPPVPETIIARLGQMEREIETQSSVREISYARLPKYASRASGVLFRGLREQDEKVLLPLIEDKNTVLEDALKFRLEIIQQHYGHPRLIKTIGRNKEPDVFYFKGAELRDNTDVKVKAGVELFSNKEVKNEVVMTFVEKGYITEPREALELLDVKGLEEYMEEKFIDERQADRENQMLKEGNAYPKVSEDDNHEVHFPKHNNQRKSSEFESWPKKSQENLLKHMEEHKGFMVEEEKPIEEESVPTAPEVEVAPVGEGGVPPPPATVPTTPEELVAELERLSGGG